jgi:hypothetical protein
VLGSQKLIKDASMADDSDDLENSGSLNGSKNQAFGKNSFQKFTKNKIKNILEAENQIDDMMAGLDKVLKKKIEAKQKKLNNADLSQRTLKRKTIELDKWCHKEKEDLK